VHNIVVIVFVSTRIENLAREKYLGKGKQSGGRGNGEIGGDGGDMGVMITITTLWDNFTETSPYILNSLHISRTNFSLKLKYV